MLRNRPVYGAVASLQRSDYEHVLQNHPKLLRCVQ